MARSVTRPMVSVHARMVSQARSVTDVPRVTNSQDLPLLLASRCPETVLLLPLQEEEVPTAVMLLMPAAPLAVEPIITVRIPNTMQG